MEEISLNAKTDYVRIYPAQFRFYTIPKNKNRKWIKVTLSVVNVPKALRLFLKFGKMWTLEEAQKALITREGEFINFVDVCNVPRMFLLFEDKIGYKRECYKGSLNFCFYIEEAMGYVCMSYIED